jgi:ATP-dependent DNA helicase RecQ
MPTPASILKNTFGYNSFRPSQREVIENVLARKDSLAIMPTLSCHASLDLGKHLGFVL